jgi:hypothetical protein
MKAMRFKFGRRGAALAIGEALGILYFAGFLACPLLAGEPDWLDKRYEALEYKSNQELRLLRSEILARHGKIFDAPDLKAFFSAQPWYVSNPAYEDSDLPQRERLLAEEISFWERDPAKGEKNYEGRALFSILKSMKPDQGVPDRIGNVVLGKKEPAKLEAGDWFAGLPGNFQTVAADAETEKVASVEYAFLISDKGREEQLVFLLAKLVGFPPRKRKRAWEWTDSKNALRFQSEDGGGLSRVYFVALRGAK